MNTRELAIQCFKDEAAAVLGLTEKLDEGFEQAVELMYSCKGKVIVTGVGKSGHIGAKIAATLSSTGTPSFFINPLDVFHGDLGVMTSDDVVLAISNSGQTDELLRFIPMVLHMQIPIIGMSGNPESLLAKYSTCFLNVGVEKEACPLNLAPTSSTMAQMAMGDALAVARQNAALLKTPGVRFFESDMLASQPSACYDIIVSNPPYICWSERESMDRNVKDFEPGQALFVPDSDPLLYYKAIAHYASQSLEHGGKLYLEINQRFGNEVKHLLESCGLDDVRIIEDSFGHVRFAAARQR